MHSGITHLIQGHQKDDIAESFLWRLSRGASPHGLCSPQPVTIHGSFKFLRPFLSFSRKEIRENLKNLQIPWREDETNQSDKFLRNRIRKKVLTSWKSEVDRDLLKGVERSRDLIEEQNEAVEIWISQTFDKVISKGNLKIGIIERLTTSNSKRGYFKMVITFKCSVYGKKPRYNFKLNQRFHCWFFDIQKRYANKMDGKQTNALHSHSCRISVERLENWDWFNSVFAGWFKNKNRKRERCY